MDAISFNGKIVVYSKFVTFWNDYLKSHAYDDFYWLTIHATPYSMYYS